MTKRKYSEVEMIGALKQKKLVADLSLDKEMLKAVIEKNGWSS